MYFKHLKLFVNIQFILKLCTGQPYQVNIRQQHSSEHPKLNKSSIEQKVLSAKMLRIKELQNQLADAHYQLNVIILIII